MGSLGSVMKGSATRGWATMGSATMMGSVTRGLVGVVAVVVGKLGAWSAVDQADPTIKLQGFWLSSSISIMYSKYLNHDLSRSNSIITAS